MLALLIFHIDLSVIALIGVILLIGIVKKNAILMIDFALAAERLEHKTSEEAIFQACILRFRPILMTTMAALFGALPLALGTGTGSELRRPLGVTIIGGLIVSQMLTLYTTPVVYLYLDRLRLRWASRHSKSYALDARGESGMSVHLKRLTDRVAHNSKDRSLHIYTSPKYRLVTVTLITASDFQWMYGRAKISEACGAGPASLQRTDPGGFQQDGRLESGATARRRAARQMVGTV